MIEHQMKIVSSEFKTKGNTCDYAVMVLKLRLYLLTKGK